MAAANASARGQRHAILASPLRELTGFYLTVDCGARGCRGARSLAIADLASFYGADSTVSDVLRRMRCSGGCGGGRGGCVVAMAGIAWRRSEAGCGDDTRSLEARVLELEQQVKERDMLIAFHKQENAQQC